MLNELLTPDVIRLYPACKDWREAVALACEPLITNGAIEARYLEAIYRSHQAIGPYYVVGPGIAMPHARPEQGVNRMALSLTVIQQGVNFDSDGNDPVRLLVVLAATDKHSHIEAIAQLAALFDNEEDTASLMAAKEISTIQRVILRY